mgnify:CR=1 FL=1
MLIATCLNYLVEQELIEVRRRNTPLGETIMEMMTTTLKEGGRRRCQRR